MLFLSISQIWNSELFNCGTSLFQKEVENIINLHIMIFEPQQQTTNNKILPKSSIIIDPMATYHQFLRHLSTIYATWYMEGLPIVLLEMFKL
jgi:hypothetical protein